MMAILRNRIQHFLPKKNAKIISDNLSKMTQFHKSQMESDVKYVLR